MSFQWTKAADNELKRMWREGVPMHTIQRELKLGQQTVDKARKRLGLPTRASTSWTPERTAEAERLYVREGKSATETAKLLGGGLTRNAIIGKSLRMGWMLNGRQTPTSLGKPVMAKKHKATASRPSPAVRAPVFGTMTVTSLGKAKESVKRKTAEGKAIVDAFPKVANDNAIPLLQRGFRQCSWPVGEPDRPGDQLCCGEPIDEAANKAVPTYCPLHGRMGLTKTAQSAPRSVKQYERSLRRFAA